MTAAITPFDDALKSCGLYPLRAGGIATLQVNLGKKCNQACNHCHVEAGPNRAEMMGDAVMDRCIALLESERIPVLDITGGAPELHPRYRPFVERARATGASVMTRCNLTILSEPGMESLPAFWKAHNVAIVVSLPYFRREETDAVRGKGVFEKSVAALQQLNETGYGVEGSGLSLNVVYNPAGAFLPASQEAIERQFRDELKKHHGISFNRLFALTNMPIARFKDHLIRKNALDGYVQRLAGAFNPGAAENVMCRSMISVGWDGFLFDCDFNQMLGLRVNHGAPFHIDEWNRQALAERQIVTGPHCYGCTAGQGSSCGGKTS
ncbi:MAG: radical SAM/Cys-rich domain protein [Candidatus Nitrosotenuis sp.]|nr:MAG: radical SAM/Cys-rich domain protein [Candidatus Nitrosotenuis sp.]